jgi:hypothetical protein
MESVGEYPEKLGNCPESLGISDYNQPRTGYLLLLSDDGLYGRFPFRTPLHFARRSVSSYEGIAP